MKAIFQMAAIIAILFSAACNSGDAGKATSDSTATAVQEGAVSKIDFSKFQLASVKDTSCGMPLSAGLEDTVNFNSKVYGFCSKECKDDFVKKLIAQNKR